MSRARTKYGDATINPEDLKRIRLENWYVTGKLARPASFKHSLCDAELQDMPFFVPYGNAAEGLPNAHHVILKGMAHGCKGKIYDDVRYLRKKFVGKDEECVPLESTKLFSLQTGRRMAITQGTLFMLGTPHPVFTEYMKGMGIDMADYERIVREQLFGEERGNEPDTGH